MATIPRADHLAWAKARALEYCAHGDALGAYTSLASDLQKHPDTAQHPAIELGMRHLMAGQLRTPEAMRAFLEGVQ